MTMHVKWLGLLRQRDRGNSGYPSPDAAEERHLATWQAAVRLGEAQLERGEGISYSPDTLSEIIDEYCVIWFNL